MASASTARIAAPPPQPLSAPPLPPRLRVESRMPLQIDRLVEDARNDDMLFESII